MYGVCVDYLQFLTCGNFLHLQVMRGLPVLDFAFKGPVISILETLAHSKHITHVKFIYISSGIHKLLGES